MLYSFNNFNYMVKNAECCLFSLPRKFGQKVHICVYVCNCLFCTNNFITFVQCSCSEMIKNSVSKTKALADCIVQLMKLARHQNILLSPSL